MYSNMLEYTRIYSNIFLLGGCGGLLGEAGGLGGRAGAQTTLAVCLLVQDQMVCFGSLARF
jgi:hypothetical protein